VGRGGGVYPCSPQAGRETWAKTVRALVGVIGWWGVYKGRCPPCNDSRHASILKAMTEAKGWCEMARESFRSMRSGL